MIIKSLAVSVLVILSAVTLKAESWRGITPLKSDRADVERLLGQPLPGGVDFIAVYKLKNEEVRVHYAVKQLCRESQRCECQVPDDTVIEVSVRSKVPLKFSSLRIDKTKFEGFPMAEDVGVWVYHNRHAGLIYAVRQKDDRVLYVQYAPMGKDCDEVLRGHSTIFSNSNCITSLPDSQLSVSNFLHHSLKNRAV